jgi:hemerythrin superfamily protein
MPEVVDRIEHDHREVEQLFAEFKGTKSKATASKICDELDKHTKAEDTAVYPVCRGTLGRARQGQRGVQRA